MTRSGLFAPPPGDMRGAPYHNHTVTFLSARSSYGHARDPLRDLRSARSDSLDSNVSTAPSVLGAPQVHHHYHWEERKKI